MPKNVLTKQRATLHPSADPATVYRSNRTRSIPARSGQQTLPVIQPIGYTPCAKTRTTLYPASQETLNFRPLSSPTAMSSKAHLGVLWDLTSPASMLGFFPSIAFDSFVTIGLTESATSEEGTINTISSAANPWPLNFENNGSVTPLTMRLEGAGLFSMVRPTELQEMMSAFFWDRSRRLEPFQAPCTFNSSKEGCQPTTCGFTLISTTLA